VLPKAIDAVPDGIAPIPQWLRNIAGVEVSRRVAGKYFRFRLIDS